MVRFVVFTAKELEDMQNGIMVVTADHDENLVTYLSEETYTNDISNHTKIKEFDDK